jgi:RNA polymerase sigma-70 factor, ECF subfamily
VRRPRQPCSRTKASLGLHAQKLLPRNTRAVRIHVKAVSMSVTSMSDEVEPHDTIALDALIAPLFLPAYRLAFGMLRNREEAEDAVQEAAFSAWRHRHTFRVGSDSRPWFFAIVANQCRSVRRNRWMSLNRQADLVTNSDGLGEELGQDIDVRRALSRLGHDDRLVLVLRYYMDMTYDEMAATLGVSDGAARSRTQRAVRRLRPKLITQELSR